MKQHQSEDKATICPSFVLPLITFFEQIHGQSSWNAKRLLQLPSSFASGCNGKKDEKHNKTIKTCIRDRHSLHGETLSFCCKSADPCLPGGARPEAVSQSKQHRTNTQRLTLKITPTLVEKRCPWARQAMLFPCSGASLFGKASGSEAVVLLVMTPKCNWRCKRWISKPNPLFLEVLDATFDTEDHPNAGRKTVSLSSPGHAVSLFWSQRFWVRRRVFAGRDAQTQL